MILLLQCIGTLNTTAYLCMKYQLLSGENHCPYCKSFGTWLAIYILVMMFTKEQPPLSSPVQHKWRDILIQRQLYSHTVRRRHCSSLHGNNTQARSQIPKRGGSFWCVRGPWQCKYICQRHVLLWGCGGILASGHEYRGRNLLHTAYAQAHSTHTKV